MFRLAKLGLCFVKRGRIPSARGVRQLFLYFHRTYRRDVKSVATATYEYDDTLYGHEEDEENFEVNLRNISTPFQNSLLEIIKSYGKNINWDEVIKRCEKIPNSQHIKREDIKGLICTTCNSKELFDALTSYFEYLVSSRELCAGTLYLMCHIINKNPKQMENCMDIVYNIYMKLPPEQELPLRICLPVLQNSEKYKQKLFNKIDFSLGITGSTVATLIANNDFETAFKFLSSYTGHISSFLPSFIQYFENLAKLQELPVSKIVCLLDLMMKNQEAGFTKQVVRQLEQLMMVLSSLDDSYKWELKETGVQDVCRVCSGKLKKVEISDEEIKILKENIREHVIFGSNINIRSSHEEWEKFLKYINKKSYDIVIDGLNVTMTFLKDPNLFSNLLKKLNKLERTPLILARQHFNTSVQYKMICKSYPVFLTQDLSDDDVFVLYAALHKGKNCYIITADQMGFAITEMQSPLLQNIYLRWQMLHQTIALPRRLILPHGLNVGLQKSPSESEDEFRYHLVVKDGSLRKVYCISRLKRH